MGDYTKTGVKIGTCGRAYYATFNQLQEKANTGDSEINYYLDPSKKCSFAFPYPEFDGKEIGDISVFHKPEHELIILEIGKKNKTFHKQLTFHKHPTGGEGLNLFCDCPYHNSENVSRNFNGDTIKFYLRYEKITESGKHAIIGECIYCEEHNILEKSEALEAVEVLTKKADRLELYYDNDSHKERNIKEALRIRNICARILSIYD